MSKVPVLILLAAVYLLAVTCQGCQGGLDIKTAQYYTNGHQLYSTHCANCHGDKGEGLGLLYPPLTDSGYLTENRSALPGIVQHGMSGEITVSGEKYNMEMPANPQLSVVEIAYILTYVTNSFGNKSGVFSEEEVLENLPDYLTPSQIPSHSKLEKSAF